MRTDATGRRKTEWEPEVAFLSIGPCGIRKTKGKEGNKDNIGTPKRGKYE